ncbi:hypothetical protein [Methylobacterium sp. sgz302541]|uniref:hypothetical protein n=1 Tax=unclassified Methylobacterium TaxID=2615210 RepID=UPI003D35626A
MTRDTFGEKPPHSGADEAPGPRSPTRRRLLALLALAPVPTGADAATTSSVSAPPHDPIPRLFGQFEALAVAHERALSRVDRLEAGLVARLGWPRVRLPTPPGTPALFAADPDTIDRHCPPGPRAQRLKRRLFRRRRVWDVEAEAYGLADALQHEASVARAVRAVGAVLLAQPAATLTSLQLKLVVLLALHAPGGACDAAEPWRGLRGVLADLAGQLADHDRERPDGKTPV